MFNVAIIDSGYSGNKYQSIKGIKTKEYFNGNKQIKHIFINNDTLFWEK